MHTTATVNHSIDHFNDSSINSLPRSLSTLETWGLGLTGPAGWIGLVIPMHVALGPQAILVWIPAALVGVLLNYQVQRLGMKMLDVAGGTPNYTSRLLKNKPVLARYAAIGYLLNWISALSMSAVILADLIQVHLTAHNVPYSSQALRIGLALLPFIVAFSGTRALSILHLFFIVPAMGLLVLFASKGLGWLVFSPDTPGFFPSSWSSLSFIDWAKWFYFATFSTYSSETTTSFLAESRSPKRAIRALDLTAWVGVCIFVGGSWVVSRLATAPNLGEDVFLHLLTAAEPFWGNWASLIIIFLIASSCLLTQAAAVSNCPRILYQLAVDGHLAPVFKVVSKRGVFGPPLTLLLLLALFYVLWGDVARIVVVGNVAWFVSFMLLHWGLWDSRKRVDVLLPTVSLGIFVIEVAVLLVGGFAWGWEYFLIGLVMPLSVLAIDFFIRRARFALFRPTWWQRHYQTHPSATIHDSLMFQVSVLIAMLCGSVLVGWSFRSLLAKDSTLQDSNFIAVLVLVVAFIGVAIACWTTLPQVIAITEARESAERAESHVREKAEQLETALRDLQQAQTKLIQSEKMSSLGQLVAGIAHEVNNPVNFIYGNLDYANEYTQDLVELVYLYQKHFPNPPEPIRDQIQSMDLEFMIQDLTKVLQSMRIGTERIYGIVRSLRNFSRMDEADLKEANLHDGIDSTLMILQNRLKAKSDHLGIEIIKEYGNVPLVECYPSQMNQVFMNLIVNSIDAIDEANQKRTAQDIQVNPSKIWIRTNVIRKHWVSIHILDNGPGIDQPILSKLFDPFFTTKPIGKGTGLGLSISYQIVCEKHNGKLYCESTVGQGTEFIIELPIWQKYAPLKVNSSHI